MSRPLRPATLYLLLSYALLSSMPFIARLVGPQEGDGWQLLGTGLLAWIAVWALFKRPVWFHILLLPAFLALPTELYLLTYYGQGISTHHLGIITETSPSEALEFLGGKAWLLGAVLLAVLLWFGSTWVVAWRTRALDWDDRSRWVVLAVLGLGTLALAFGGKLGLPSLPVERAVVARSWPFGLSMRGVDFYKERIYLAELNRRSAAFRFGASQPEHGPQVVVVVVIGESSRYDRWSLNGYARETNPLLAKEDNLVMLKDVITPVSATRLSVPVIISRKPAMQSLKDGFTEKSFLSAFKEAGFKTF